MANLTRTQTLVDIAKHSNKVIRLSRLMEETEAQYLIDKMSFLDSQSDPFEIMQALDADLGITSKMLKDVSLMVDSLGPDHRAGELKSDENDFTALFPNNYSPERQELTLFDIPIKKGANFSKTETVTLKEMLYNRIFKDIAEDYPFKEYRSHLSVLRSMEKTGRPSLDAAFHDRLKYATQAAQLPKWTGFYRAAIDSAGRFHDFRRNLTDKERRLVDEKVYSGRAMIYGVVKSSTYITKESGVEQLSGAHKKNPNLVSKIQDLVNNIDCLTAVEIDQNTSLEKFHDMLIDIKEMRLDVPDAFELKTRLLGNYRASGLFAQVSDQGGMTLSPEYGYSSKDFKIVAVDVNAPTSVSHELTHFRDQDPDDKTRNQIVSHFAEKMDIRVLEQLIPGGKLEYFTDDREVLARLGEIGFKLLQHDYQENESLDSFVRRVQEEEGVSQSHDEKIEYQVSLSKPISTYLGGNSLHREIYFKLEQWSPTELSILKDYCHSYFYSPDQKIQERLKERIDSGELQYQSRKYHEERMAGRPKRTTKMTDHQKVGSTFGNISPLIIADVYDAGKKSKLFDDGEFAEQIFLHADRLGQGGGKKAKRSIRSSEWEAQLEGLFSLANRIDPSQNPGDAIVAESSLLALSDKMLALDMVDKEAINESLERRSFLDQVTLLAESYKPYMENGDDISFSMPKTSTYYRMKSPQQRKNSSVYKLVADNLVPTLHHLSQGLPENLMLSLQSSSPVTQWTGLAHELYRHSKLEVNLPLDELAEDFLDYTMDYHAAEFLATLEGEYKEKYVRNVVSFLPLERAIPYRHAMDEVLKKPELTSHLIDNEFIEAFDVTPAHLNDFMKEVNKKLEGTVYQGFGWEPISDNAGIEEVKKRLNDFSTLRSQRLSNEKMDGTTLLIGAALKAGARKGNVSMFLAKSMESPSLGIDWNDIFTTGSYGLYNTKFSVPANENVMRPRAHGVNGDLLLQHLPMKNLTKVMEGTPELDKFGFFKTPASEFAESALLYATAEGITELASLEQSYTKDYQLGAVPFTPSNYEMREMAKLIGVRDKIVNFEDLREVYVRGADALIPPYDKEDLFKGATSTLDRTKEQYLPFWLQAKAMSPDLAAVAIGGLSIAAGPIGMGDRMKVEHHRMAALGLARLGRMSTYPIWMEGNIFKGTAPLLDAAISHLQPIEKTKLNLPTQLGDLPRATLDEWVDAIKNNDRSEIPWEKLSNPQIQQMAAYAKEDLNDGELYWAIAKPGLQASGDPGSTPRTKLDEVADQVRSNRPLIELDLTADLVSDFIDYARNELDDSELAETVVSYYLNPSSRRESELSKPTPQEEPALEKEKKKEQDPIEIKEPLGPDRQMRMF